MSTFQDPGPDRASDKQPVSLTPFRSQLGPQSTVALRHEVERMVSEVEAVIEELYRRQRTSGFIIFDPSW